MRYTLLILLIVFSLLPACQTDKYSCLWDVVSDPKSSEDVFDKAIQILHSSQPSQEFWRKIVADSHYSLNKRQIAVMQLIARNVKTGMSVAEFSSVLDGAKWMQQDDIRNVSVWSSIPLKDVPMGDSVLCISLNFGVANQETPKIYLQFKRPFQVGAMFDAIRGVRNKESQLLIVDYGSSAKNKRGSLVYNTFGLDIDSPFPNR